MHGLQPLHGFQEQAFSAHRQVTTFHQRQAQITRQVSMLEIGFAVGAGGQQHDPRRVAARHGGGALFQRVQQAAVAAGYALRVQLTKRIRELARNDQAVVQHITQPRRPLRALRHQPPATIRPTRQIKSHDVQALAAGYLRPHHGAQPARVAQQQCGRQQALVQQGLRAIEIGQHLFQQLCALRHAGLNDGPVGRLYQQWQQLQRPGPRGHACAWRVGKDVVCDTVVAQALFDLADAAVEVFGHAQAGVGRWQLARKGLPGGAQGAVCTAQFVPHARRGRHGVRCQRVGRSAAVKLRCVKRQRALPLGLGLRL